MLYKNFLKKKISKYKFCTFSENSSEEERDHDMEREMVHQ